MVFLNAMLAQRLGFIDQLFVAYPKRLMMRKLLQKISYALLINMDVMAIGGLRLFFILKDGELTISEWNVSGERRALKFLKNSPKENAFI